MDFFLIFIIIALSALTIAFIRGVKPVIIGKNEIGIIYKKITLNPLQPPSHQQIALQGEAGVQADILPAGQYWRYWSWLYTINKVPLIKVPDGKIGLVFAKHGAPIPSGRQLGQVVDCKDFQDARAFLTNDGQKGRQIGILAAGEYRINTELFDVTTVPLIKVPDEKIGLVFANDGASIPSGQQLGRVVDCNDFQDAQAFLRNGGQKGEQMGILTTGNYQINTALFDVVTSSTIDRYNGKLTAEDLRVYTVDRDKIGIVTTSDGAPAGRIAAPTILGHGNFQNGQKFIDAGGYRGLQEEIISAGAYNLNPWFVKVKQVPLIRIPAGTVGVVIYDIEKTPEKQARHELVEPGNKGIWKTPLYPGRHAINTEVMSVMIVPTNPIVLDWMNKDKTAYNYDTNLHPLNLRSKDGFLFKIEVTQIIRIEPQDAPQMILSIGTRETEATDEMVSNDSGSTYKRYSSIRNLVTKVLEPTIGNHFSKSAQDYNALDFHDTRSEQQDDAKDYINAALSEHGVQGINTLIHEIDLADELEEILKERKISDENIKNYEKKLLEERARESLVVYKAEVEVKLARLNAEARIYETGAEAEAIRQRKEVEIKVLEAMIELLGSEGYLEKRRIEQLADIKLPDTVIGNNGLLDALMARMLGSGRDQQAPNEKDYEQIKELIINLIQNNVTNFIDQNSSSDSPNPSNSPEIVTPPVREIPSGSDKDDTTTAKVIITKPEQE